MKANQIIKDGASLNKLIVSIGTQGKKIDDMIQIAGVSALDHLAAHGDVGFVNRLYLGVSKGVRKAALTSWLLAHGSLVANTEGNKKEMPFKFTKDKATNVAAALAEPWVSHKPDAEPDAVYDLQTAIKAIIKKAASAKELKHGEAVPELQRLLDEMTGEDTPPVGDASDTETSDAEEKVDADLAVQS
jgi:hypothetical protein